MFQNALKDGYEPQPVPSPMPQKRPGMMNVLSQGFDAVTQPGPVQNALKSGASAFARGFIGPDGVAKIQDRRHELKQREDADIKTKLAKTKAWLEQTRQIPASEREAWTMQNAEAIFRDTGQRPSMGQGGMAGGMGANPYDDAELDKGIAAISAQLGQGPAVEEDYTLAPGAQRRRGSKVIAENPAAENRNPIIGRPGDVILSREDKDGDGMLDQIFSVAPEEKPPWPGAVKNAQGQWVYDPNYISGQTALRSAGKPETNVYTGDVTKANETALQGKVLDATAVLSRLKGIEATYDPKFLTIQSQASNFVRSGAERLGMDLKPEDKAALQQFTTFQQNTMNNLNRTLQELSGAAVTPQEFERIKQELPAMQDGPTGFKTKMENAIQLQRAAIARQQYFLQNGIPLNDEIAAKFPLEQFIQDVAQQGAPNLGAGQGRGNLSPKAQDSIQELKALGYDDAQIDAIINGQ